VIGVQLKLSPLILFCSTACAVGLALCSSGASVSTHEAPAGEELSKDYVVQVEGQNVPVYSAKVAPADPARRWKAMDDKAHSGDYFARASFAYFGMDGPVNIRVTCPETIRTAKVLPASFGITPTLDGQSLAFQLKEPKPLTVEVNGKWVSALHLFANPSEANIPHQGDPNVIYFGPGIHEIGHVVVSNNQTVYVAAGAIVRGVIRTNEPFGISGYSGLRVYSPTFLLKGDHIVFRGRGIVDGSLCPPHARHLLMVQGRDINLEGVILRDSSTWTIPIRQSENIRVNNVKLLGRRANADGIDICNSRDVRIEGCFIRTLDDLIVVKTDRHAGESHHILVTDCVLWNEVAHALSIGAELRENVDDVAFTNCDIIHDKGREWTLRIYHCDSAHIRNVRFENLRIEESPRLISLWINKGSWSRDNERGHIEDVLFKNIRAVAEPLRVELQGFDPAHAVDNVRFENVVVNGKLLLTADVKTNAFVTRVVCRP
jgi:hypothetical protein